MGFEQILGALVGYGPQGVAFAILSLVVLYLFRALRESDKETKEEIRRSLEALVESTASIREANESRLALTRAMDDMQRLLKELAGRIERTNSLVDNIDRRMAIAEAARLGQISKALGNGEK